jgi:hypothetical protein
VHVFSNSLAFSLVCANVPQLKPGAMRAGDNCRGGVEVALPCPSTSSRGTNVYHEIWDTLHACVTYMKRIATCASQILKSQETLDFCTSLTPFRGIR